MDSHHRRRRPRKTAHTGLVPHDRLVATIDRIPLGVGHAAPDGAWLFVNPRLCELVGVSAERLLNGQEGTASGLGIDLFEAGGHYSRELRIERPDGTPVWIRETVSVVSADGAPAYLLVSTEDVTEQHHLQERVARLETRLTRKSELIDLSLDAIFAWSLQSNQIVYWSKGAERTYGWTRGEAEGLVASELLRTEFPQPLPEILAAVERSGRWEGDLVHTTRSGRRITVASRWGVQRDGGGSRPPVAVLEVNRDVTAERQELEARMAFAREQQRVAEALQKSLLMTPPPDLYPGLTVKPIYQGAQEDILVGGDFFDIFAVSENRIALTVGDVTGKGLEAATYTAELKFALRAFLREHQHPGAALTRLNAFVADKERLDADHLGSSYAAVAVVVVATDTGAVEVASAGAEHPVIVRAGGEVREAAGGGPLLGAAPDASFADFADELSEGDVVLMMTDGLVEARAPSSGREFFGTDRLVAVVKEELSRRSQLSDAGTAVVDRVRAFAGGAIQDDVCLLLARRNLRAAAGAPT